MTGVHSEKHSMTRIDIATGVAFDEFVDAFEEAAPPFDPAPVQRALASTAFGSLGIAEVTEVGEGLDRKVWNLLLVLGVDAQQTFA